ncbi:KR domain-containing protein [Hirsutella rhossiliensis]|uniref:KR domain-containing protein n=1 Tax=Hirsutella rhossiliensis TaxID=111463 RepID=A0A9P8MN28_9HYPO|nr:KR domain-containing protein [Hirsutella rhossiliensis]KAH0957419.1 KR domain-containing protein [Hirsutella rhossiliensis]
MASSNHIQEPVAIIGLACRLPGGNNSPHKLWDFLERGGIASNKVPESRFNIEGHWDGSLKPRTMRPSGGMFLEDVDPADFDASFFEISRTEAISMDPNQRQMLEVVFEGLENAGIPLESLNGAPVGCFVGSYASDYGDMQGRDPEDRPASITVGVGRAIMANRLSHFLNIKGPSMTIDTACSGSLVALDIACRYLQSREIDAAIIAASNLYLNPEHVMDIGAVGHAHSPTGLCHTFDIDADGYVKAEAVSAVIVKRLSDAIRDRDPIRAVVRGSATNSDGRTPGIASPSADAQAAAIRAAYAKAGITNLNDTAYLECHGTGTQAGDPTEVSGASSVFAKTRPADKPLIIGSIKSNIGHAEPAAGISGLIKATMAIERGIIPGTPTFQTPNPKIDFAGLRVRASRAALPWPECTVRRASVNSFGYGGSNAHAVLEQPSLPGGPHHVSSYVSDDDDLAMDDREDSERPYTLVLSANDNASLRANIKALCNHLFNPRVRVSLADLAHTLADRRTQFWHRAFVTTRSTELNESAFVVGKKNSEAPRLGFVFTGQGAQWPQMGKALLEFFPWTRTILQELDGVLQSLPDPPSWSLVDELTETRSAEHLRQPEFSQPLVTALQLCIVAVLESWGIKPRAVVGHSSGEIAAAYAAGLLDRAAAIKAAFYRGRAALNRKDEADGDVGMLAVGLDADSLAPYLEKYAGQAWIACFNSPSSLTVSGRRPALQALAEDVQADKHFARLLQVDLAYHSELMGVISQEYERLLNEAEFASSPGTVSGTSMFSSVTGSKRTTATDALYWKTNMASPVRFDRAVQEMLADADAPNFLVEIGPSGALAGPVSQILKSAANGSEVSYCAAWSRGSDAGRSMFDLVGRLFVAGEPINMSQVNQLTPSDERPRTIIDLPNYAWNHSVKYWHENASSKDWRFKQYTSHDLLGSKVLGTLWTAPTWRKLLDIADIPWLKDHKMGTDVLMPGSGFITMAVEALYQKSRSTAPDNVVITRPNDLCYRLRDVRFEKALVLEEGKNAVIVLSLAQQKGWHEFRIASSTDDVHTEHCSGRIRLEDPVDLPLAETDQAALKFPTPSKVWYKAQAEAGYGFGPAFQKLLKVESVSGQRHCRSLVSLDEPESKWSPQSCYPIHPAALDGCFQTVTPSLWSGEPSSLTTVLVPAMIDELVINKTPDRLHEGLSLANSEYSGRGRLEEAKSYFSNCSVYNPESGALLMQMKGLRFAKLDVGEKPDPHVFDCVSWKPDISFLSQERLFHLGSAALEANARTIVDLIAHKTPALRVLEVNLEPSDTSCFWFDDDSATPRAAYVQYDFASCDASSLVGVQATYQNRRSSSFLLVNLSGEDIGLPEEAVYDLVILKTAQKSRTKVNTLIEHLSPRVSSDGYVLLMQQRDVVERADSDDDQQASDTPRTLASPETPGTPGSMSERSMSSLSPETPASSTTTRAATPDGENHPKRRLLELKAVEQRFRASGTALQIALEANGFSRTLHLAGDNAWCLYTGGAKSLDVAHSRNCCVVRLSETTPALSPAIGAALGAAGWRVSEQAFSASSTDLPTESVILVLDEMQHGPMLTQANSRQWDALKMLVSSGQHILWVTKGAQYKVTDPDNALVHGLFRVARREDPSAKLSVLDVESGSGPATAWAIDAVLGYLSAKKPDEAATETEFVERGGILYVHRLVPDAKVNRFNQDDREGAEPVVKSLRDTETAVQLRAERLGTFQSLMWCETDVEAVPVESAKVEVEVAAVGVNFKDVAVTMGIVPENEYALGYEAAGVVKRLGPGVTEFKVGDRVCFLNSGSYANRLQVPVGRAHTIPDWMSFEEAATIPSVYLCSIYSLYDIANLRQGQSVLIHSASGGVGIACIQLAQYKKAEIFVTVGTDEKRKFLAETYGIPYSHMFSSRNTKFAKEILKATSGRGVDVIINSLTGELLDASWRICADGGTMVEIGKKDIVDRNSLSMEPFDRNCSFRAMDFSFTRDIVDPLIARLLDQIFDLVDGGHIKPIHPITTFGFDAVPAALAYIRSGRHLGKVVISDENKETAHVPVRPATRKLQLRPDAAYLIVGGLKGLCGSLAIHMARNGARHIVVCNRSGIADDASQKVVTNCLAYGCEVVAAKGDVADMGLLRRAFAEAPRPIAGVIQGAMMLRDKPYETMTVDDWHAALHAKMHGTWGLHRISLEQAEPLDFFTMLSSISGIVGNKGQANYAAANTFLDAFALYRQSLGLAASSVDLGLIEDVGYVAEQDHDSLEARFDKRQWTPIGEATLRRILTCSVLQQDGAAPINPSSVAQLITGIGFPLPRDSDLAGEGRFGYLIQGDATTTSTGDVQGGNEELRALRMLHKSAPDDRAALVKACIRVLAGQLAKILRLGDETGAELEPAKPLMALGLDSLAAVELRNWVRAELGAELTTLEITGASSLTALCEKLVSKLPAAAS